MVISTGRISTPRRRENRKLALIGPGPYDGPFDGPSDELRLANEGWSGRIVREGESLSRELRANSAESCDVIKNILSSE